eukprot:gnl/MRDRNA2_/MRDRNA2_29733_c0_seq1.p1 gnl/MRDRNA2_/MRDRNA2_29733_c0~~gnl/MRDRNA2_/MRDRNA2_29733_c0_seq1.p1  ORF type:complete len:128 (-),score=25.54 gnl/MRDRNA2_/MRDRNA2_29733_c0_seq1:143-526(-)
MASYAGVMTSNAVSFGHLRSAMVCGSQAAGYKKMRSAMLEDASSPDAAGSINMRNDMFNDASSCGAAPQFGHVRTAMVCQNPSGDTDVPFGSIRSAVLELDDNSGSRKRSLVQRLGDSLRSFSKSKI